MWKVVMETVTEITSKTEGAPLRKQRKRRTQDLQAMAFALRRNNQVVGVAAMLPSLQKGMCEPLVLASQ